MPSPEKETFVIQLGEALERLRHHRGSTLEDVARGMGEEPSSAIKVARWERGTQPAPRADELWRYLQAVDATFFDLDRELHPPEIANPRLREIAEELESLAREDYCS